MTPSTPDREPGDRPDASSNPASTSRDRPDASPAGDDTPRPALPDGRVFAMGESGLVTPDFPALTEEEIAAVLIGSAGPRVNPSPSGTAAHVGSEESGSSAAAERFPVAKIPVEILWRSRRPLSATARVRFGNGTPFVVKRMPSALRDPDTLAPEHAFMNHLRAQGIPIPHVEAVRHGAFTYEIQELGVGEDRYRDKFSWSPYHSVDDARAAGAMLARLHLAAAGFDAPERPPHPLLAALCTDPVATIEHYAAARPEVGRFLAEQDWRSEWERVVRQDTVPSPDRALTTDMAVRDPAADDRALAAAVSTLPALWTHNDWHGTNLLWSGGEITTVLDFGLANRTVAVFDLATAIERFAVDWLSIAAGGPAHVQAEQLAAFLHGYTAIRPLSATEQRLLPELFPRVHIAYELSEIDYFLTIPPRRQVRSARIAYRNYLLGRSVWAASAEGKTFTTMVRELSGSGC